MDGARLQTLNTIVNSEGIGELVEPEGILFNTIINSEGVQASGGARRNPRIPQPWKD